MEKEEVYKRIDDYLDYLVSPVNKTLVKLNKHNAIDANAIKTLKHYELIVYRYPLDEHNSMVDITAAGAAVKPAGGIKNYIELVEHKRNVSAMTSPVGPTDYSNQSNHSLNRTSTDKKTTFVKFKKSRADKTYLIIAIVVALIAAYKVLHEMNLISF